MAQAVKDRPKDHATGTQRINPICQEKGRIMFHNQVNANRLMDGPDPVGAVCVPTGSEGKITPGTVWNKDIIMVTHYSFSVLPCLTQKKTQKVRQNQGLFTRKMFI
jgi:hypothetical protein